jgi:CRP-like cAMP-binding protein
MLQNLYKKIGKSYKKGRYIFHLGDQARAMYHILKGRVSIKCGKEKDPIVSTDEYCVEDTEVLEINDFYFEHYIKVNPAAVRKILDVLSIRLRETTDKLAEAMAENKKYKQLISKIDIHNESEISESDQAFISAHCTKP